MHQAKKIDRKNTILIVEDNSIVAMELEESLSKAGYKIIGSVSNGQSAIDIVTTITPELVLMDIRLEEEMDGTRTAREIQKISPIPVIFLTAHSDRKNMENAKKSNPYGYIIKPYNEATLLSTIEMALHKSRQSGKLTKEMSLITSILNSISGLVFVTDPYGKILYMNEPARNTVINPGSSKSILNFNNIIVIKDNVTGTRIPIPFEKKITGGSKSAFDDCIVTISGNTSINAEISFASLSSLTLIDKSFSAFDTFSNINNKNGQKIDHTSEGVIIYIKDISMRKRREQRIDQELEKTVSMQKNCSLLMEWY